MRPQGVALPVLNIAIWLHRIDNRIADARLALGTSGPIPMRAKQAEVVLQGEKKSPALIDVVYDTMLDELINQTSPYRSSADYGSHMAKVLLQEVLETAWSRTGNG